MNLLREKQRARGHHCPQFGGGSSSASSTKNEDRRNAVSSGLGVSGDGNAITVTDGGIVSRALDTVDVSNAINAQGFSGLLDASGNVLEFAKANNTQLVNTLQSMFNTSEGLIGQTQKAVADAYGMAETTKQGTIDNKTIIVLAVAAAGALVLMKRGKA